MLFLMTSMTKVGYECIVRIAYFLVVLILVSIINFVVILWCRCPQFRTIGLLILWSLLTGFGRAVAAKSGENVCCGTAELRVSKSWPSGSSILCPAIKLTNAWPWICGLVMQPASDTFLNKRMTTLCIFSSSVVCILNIARILKGGGGGSCTVGFNLFNISLIFASNVLLGDN